MFFTLYTVFHLNTIHTFYIVCQNSVCLQHRVWKWSVLLLHKYFYTYRCKLLTQQKNTLTLIVPLANNIILMLFGEKTHKRHLRRSRQISLNHTAVLMLVCGSTEKHVKITWRLQVVNLRERRRRKMTRSTCQLWQISVALRSFWVINTCMRPVFALLSEQDVSNLFIMALLTCFSFLQTIWHILLFY